MLRELALQSAMVVPLVARGGVIGELLLASSESGRRFDHGDLELAQELARRAGTAIENAHFYELARRASEARDSLLAIVSHDLRNPLSSNVMGASILLSSLPSGEDEAAETARQVAARIARAAGGMNRLIGDLLDVVSVEAGHLIIEKNQHGVALLVQDAIEMQQTLATAKALALTAEIREGGDLNVACDRERILQVFANLIGNAIKFTPEGGSITVRFEVRGSDVRFAVTDRGRGIPADALPHVFDRFWQAPQTARQGTGLGLSIASGIVEAHGGKIWVESEPGVSTTFFFTLPLGSMDAPPPTRRKRVRKRARPGSKTKKPEPRE
jgi:signal transduction histidine kinase